MNSIRSFLAGIVDYAGLFPPAGLEMESAVRDYAEYREGEDRDLLGRFVIPAARLDEFTDAARGVLDREEAAEPWRLSVLAGDDFAAASKAILEFSCSHGRGSELGRAVCDAVELHARTEADVTAAAQAFPNSFRLFMEVAPDPDPRSMLAAISRHSASAKIRTGGVTEDSFPSSASIIRFISGCNELGLSFKATAGLHHALRSDYPFTYERDSARGMMFGYLNLFLATAFIRNGMSDSEVRQVLEERSIDAFAFREGGVSWRDHDLSASDLGATRSQLALSFGSCSFREPVDEARALHLI